MSVIMPLVVHHLLAVRKFLGPLLLPPLDSPIGVKVRPVLQCDWLIDVCCVLIGQYLFVGGEDVLGKFVDQLVAVGTLV